MSETVFFFFKLENVNKNKTRNQLGMTLWYQVNSQANISVVFLAVWLIELFGFKILQICLVLKSI